MRVPFAVRLAFAWAVNALALWIANGLFSGVDIHGGWAYVIGAAVLGIANTIIKPILTLLTLPLVIVTLGLFYFVINVLMLALAEWIAPDFSIDGFWTYVGATIVVSIVNWAMYAIYGMFEGSKRTEFAA